MLRRFAAATAVVALLLMAAPSAALAAPIGDTGGPSGNTDDGNYTPHLLIEPTLAGSTADGMCVGDAPWIQYSVTLTDPDNLSTGHTARLVITKGSDIVVVPLGALVNNKLSGRVLWPGASVDSHGKATGWPGWVEQNGQLVETNDPAHYGWTRSGITATIEVNPQVVVPLEYPPATAACASPNAEGAPAGLAATGLGIAVAPIAIGAFAVLAVGGGLLIVRKLRHR